MGKQMGTDSGFGEGNADQHALRPRLRPQAEDPLLAPSEQLQLERVRLDDVLRSPTPVSLAMKNDLPFFQDAAHKFA